MMINLARRTNLPAPQTRAGLTPYRDDLNVATAARALDAILKHYRPLAGRICAKAECLRLIEYKGPEPVQSALAGLSSEWEDHAIASIYAILMPSNRRKMLGVYFTPPHLVDHLLWRMTELGVNVSRHIFRDSAAGGAAFLVPLARRMVASWRAEGIVDHVVPGMLRKRLLGMEIDRELADIANALLRRMLWREWGIRPSLIKNFEIVRMMDALSSRSPSYQHDHEVGNPPYRRLSAAEHAVMRERFADIASGRLNLYAMFMRHALGEMRAGGLVGHVVPASFLGGPEFSAFRRRILELAEVLVVDLVDQRSHVFVDATQDACFVVLRRRDKETRDHEGRASSGILHADGHFEATAEMRIPADGSPWHLPGYKPLPGATLAEWGYRATVGYLVPHRQNARMHERPGDGRLPLIWAKAVCPDGTFDHERGASAKRPAWVSVPPGARYVIREPCVVVQRTSSRDQYRRLVAAAVPEAFMLQHGGLVGENHVLILVRSRSDAPPPEKLAEVLNAPSASSAMNQVCGSASIPKGTIEKLRLPPPPDSFHLCR